MQAFYEYIKEYRAPLSGLRLKDGMMFSGVAT